MEELKNSPGKGGLGLPCLRDRSKALMLSQLLRMLWSEDRKSLAHVGYWIGELLVGIDAGEHAQDVPVYFGHLVELVVDAKSGGFLRPSNWRTVTSKAIYMHHLKSLAVAKVEQEAGRSYKTVWERAASPVLTACARDVLYLLIHNKLPIRERMFRIGLATDPYCDSCLSAEICDIEHFFCSCSRVSDVWQEVRAMVVRVVGVDCGLCSDWELINLHFPSSLGAQQAVWLIGTFVSMVWDEIFIRRGPGLKKEQCFGFLKFKYKMAQELGISLGIWPGLAM